MENEPGDATPPASPEQPATQADPPAGASAAPCSTPTCSLGFSIGPGRVGSSVLFRLRDDSNSASEQGRQRHAEKASGKEKREACGQADEDLQEKPAAGGAKRSRKGSEDGEGALGGPAQGDRLMRVRGAMQLVESYCNFTLMCERHEVDAARCGRVGERKNKEHQEKCAAQAHKLALQMKEKLYNYLFSLVPE
jgi:hypothetical protein